MTTDPIPASGSALPETPASAWTLANEHISKLAEIKAMMTVITGQFQEMTYGPDDPNTPPAQLASTLLCITFDLVDQACAGADAVFKAIVTVKP